MRKMKMLMMIALSTVLLSGCQTNKPEVNYSSLQDTIGKNNARIVVSRDESLLYFAAPVKVEANHKQIAMLKRGGTSIYDIEAGNVSIKVSTPTAFGQFVLLFDARPQQVYKFKVSPNKGALLLGSAFGAMGDAVNASISDASGYFQIEMVK